MTIAEIEDRLQGRTPGVQGTKREYGVLVPLVELNGAPHLLFEVRADTLKRQPGEVCFPGGRRELGESLWECAVRETGEELNIPTEAIHSLAPLDFICSQGGFNLHPFLAWVEAAAVTAMSPGVGEVKETFLVPLAFFREQAPICHVYDLIPHVGEDFPYSLIGFPQGYPWQKGNVDVPIYCWQGRAIWGLTGRIVRHLVSLLDEGTAWKND